MNKQKACVFLSCLLGSLTVSATARLEPNWDAVTIKTSLGDVVQIANTENKTAISIKIEDEKIVIDQNLPAPGAIVPAGIAIETESVKHASGKYEIWRVIRLTIFDEKSGNDNEIEYHVSPNKGLCKYKKYDQQRNIIEMKTYC